MSRLRPPRCGGGAPSRSPTGSTAWPRGQTLSVRTEPDPSAEVVGEIRGRTLVVGRSDATPSRTTWCRVKVGCIVGWAGRRRLVPE